ncbi:hypothetical protein F4823DRAFT_566745 [Ustulina deusta]|nr:hypothetical protein F4823DRAFT_566745 [Ustulina deusta]
MATQRQQSTLKMDLSTLQSAEIEQAKPKPGPQSPQLEKDARRAMSHTASWQPSLAGRREGYRQEDRRHELMMGSASSARGICDIAER